MLGFEPRGRCGEKRNRYIGAIYCNLNVSQASSNAYLPKILPDLRNSRKRLSNLWGEHKATTLSQTSLNYDVSFTKLVLYVKAFARFPAEMSFFKSKSPVQANIKALGDWV